jgi:two-component system NtrC family sensor kinase
MADDAATVEQLRAELRQARDEIVALRADVEGRDRAQAEALEQQTTTAEILRVIADSATDAEPLLHAIAQSAMQLSESGSALVGIRDGDVIRVAAVAGEPDHPVGSTHSLSQRRLGPVALLERRTIHVPDLAHPSYLAEFPDAMRLPARAALMTPLIRGNVAIGVLEVARDRAQPYSERQIELMGTFADQAVIAIEAQVREGVQVDDLSRFDRATKTQSNWIFQARR